MASISLRNISKSFDGKKALDNISFDVEDNAFFCLFGPPLCGKSTILKIILGLIEPDQGEVLIDGQVVNALSPAERNVAMVFQNLALFPHLSAEENVRFPLVERGIDPGKISKRVSEVSEKLHISQIMHKPPAQLSGGERQRVAIARALVRDPEVYLMDDPISALDARLREQTRVELRRIQEELGHTLIYVTHDQEEAMSVADTMAIMDEGRIQQIGPPDTLYDSPNSEYVARLLGAPAINIMPASFLDQFSGESIASNRRINATSFGLRPEDIQIESNGVASTPRARVLGVEPLGGYTTLTLGLGDQKILATTRQQSPLRDDDLVGISFDISKAHFFDAQGDAVAASR